MHKLLLAAAAALTFTTTTPVFAGDNNLDTVKCDRSTAEKILGKIDAGADSLTQAYVNDQLDTGVCKKVSVDSSDAVTITKKGAFGVASWNGGFIITWDGPFGNI